MPMKKGNKEKKVYFSPAEWEVVLCRSANLGIRTGTYIRTIAVQGTIKIYPLKELDDVHRALNRIGVNLNQLATVANSTGIIYQKDMEDVLAEMKKLRVIMEDWLEPLKQEVLL